MRIADCSVRVVLTSAALILAVTFALHHHKLFSVLAHHGWDRALEILPERGANKVSVPPATPSEMIAAFQKPFNWGRILSAQALVALRRLPEVESVHLTMPDNLTLDESGRRVSVTVVEPDFISAFALGDSSRLTGADLFLASSANDAATIMARYPGSAVTLKLPPIQWFDKATDEHMAKKIPARNQISSAVFVPRPLRQTDVTEFFASPEWVAALGQRSGLATSGVYAVVKVRAGVNTLVAQQAIQQILDEAPSPLMWPGDVARARPLMDSYQTDRIQSTLMVAGQWISVALTVAFALAAFAAIWMRFRSLNLELALRRSFGQPKWQAALQTLRSELIGLSIATAAACLIAWAWFAVQGYPWAAPKLWPAAWGGVAIGGALALLLARAVVRKPAALLLKAQVG